MRQRCDGRRALLARTLVGGGILWLGLAACRSGPRVKTPEEILGDVLTPEHLSGLVLEALSAGPREPASQGGLRVLAGWTRLSNEPEELFQDWNYWMFRNRSRLNGALESALAEAELGTVLTPDEVDAMFTRLGNDLQFALPEAFLVDRVAQDTQADLVILLGPIYDTNLELSIGCLWIGETKRARKAIQSFTMAQMPGAPGRSQALNEATSMAFREASSRSKPIRARIPQS